MTDIEKALNAIAVNMEKNLMWGTHDPKCVGCGESIDIVDNKEICSCCEHVALEEFKFKAELKFME